MRCGIWSNRSFQFQHDDRKAEGRALLIERASPAFSLLSFAKTTLRRCPGLIATVSRAGGLRIAIV